MKIQKATTTDLKFMADIGKRNSLALGFIPLPRLEKDLNKGRIHILQENNDKLGYIYFSDKYHGVSKVWQVVIREDARRYDYGKALVDSINADCVFARCAADISGTIFWKAIGAKEIGRRRPKTTRNREIIIYQQGDFGLFRKKINK